MVTRTQGQAEEATLPVGREEQHHDRSWLGSTHFGRYVLIEWLGGGGGGEVYVAYDPELDRKVAIKLLLDPLGTDEAQSGGSSLLREAQALARLSHPNVVSVYDVGSYDPQALAEHGVVVPPAERESSHFYVVMELLQGQSLTRWLSAAPRTWAEVLAVMVEAARGLAAAHDRDLIHRDFKPSNVLVGADGRARVLDFGLARAVAAVPHGDGPHEPRERLLDSQSTLTGTVLGTPSYMSPEQHRGDSTSVRSDIYSFFATFYQALYQRPPFAGHTLTELHDAKLRGAPAAPPHARVPRWLHGLIRRGLEPESSERFASMHEVLEALERVPQRRRRLAVGGGLAVIASLAIAVGVNFRLNSHAPCSEELRAGGLWDQATQEHIAARFAALGRPYLEQSWLIARDRIDRYVDDWSDARTQACEATLVRKQQPLSAMNKTLSCLDNQRLRLDALIEVLREPDLVAAENATRAVQQLPDVDACAADPLARPGAETRAEHRSGASADVERLIAQAISLRVVARFEDALGAAKRAVERADAAGDPDQIARAKIELGDILLELTRSSEAEATYREAVYAAERSGDTALVVGALGRLADAVGRALERVDEGLHYARQAEARLQQRGIEDRLSLELRQRLARVLRAGGKLEEARALLEDSLAAAGILFGQDHSTFTSLRYDLAILLVSGVDTDRAFLLLQEHLAQIRGLHGSRHPVVAATLANLAAHAFNLGRHDDAKRYIEDALSILDASVDRCHDTRVSAVNLSALVSAQLGDADAGIERGQEALQCVAGKHGISHARYKEVAGSLATIMLAQKRYEDVEAVLDPILQVLPPLEDATTFDSEIMRMAAFLHQAQGREGDALAWGQKALAVGRRLLPADSTWLADYEYDVGGFLVGLGRCEEALPLLEHGVDIQQAAQAGAMVVARTRLLMVRCLERSDPKRARELAAQALPTFEAEPRWAEDRDYLRSVAGVRRPSKSG